MVNEMVHLRLDPKMRIEIKKIVRDDLFKDESEFIRDAIRRNIELHRKIQLLKSMQGKLKPSKNPTKISLSEAFKAVGLED
jgi:Arc/MetJ-type ribon-helix-helix transcriptional regulator